MRIDSSCNVERNVSFQRILAGIGGCALLGVLEIPADGVENCCNVLVFDLLVTESTPGLHRATHGAVAQESLLVDDLQEFAVEFDVVGVAALHDDLAQALLQLGRFQQIDQRIVERFVVSALNCTDQFPRQDAHIVFCNENFLGGRDDVGISLPYGRCDERAVIDTIELHVNHRVPIAHKII